MFGHRTAPLLALLAAVALGDKACRAGEPACADDGEEQGLLQLHGAHGVVEVEPVRSVPPVSEWPSASGSCSNSVGGHALLKASRALLKLMAWHGYNADSVLAWKTAMNMFLCKDVSMYVNAVGVWTPRHVVVEFLQLLNPAYSGGFLKVTDIEIDPNSEHCDVASGLISFNATLTARFRVGDSIAYNSFSGLHISLAHNKQGHCFSASYVEVPPVAIASLPVTPVEAICQGGQQLCGSYFPYASVGECLDFMNAIPAQCGPSRFSGNTSACRSVHLIAAPEDPATFCPLLGREPRDPTTGEAVCAEAACPADGYIEGDASQPAFDYDNCYTRAGAFAACQKSMSSAECCGAIRAYDEMGCFCDTVAMQDLPSMVHMFQKLGCLSCGLTMQKCT